MEAISETKPTARKRHQCTLCSGPIKKGQRYLRQFVVDGGDCWAWKECEACTAMLEVLRDAGVLGRQEDVMSDHYDCLLDDYLEIKASLATTHEEVATVSDKKP